MSVPHDVKVAICAAKWTSTLRDLAQQFGVTKGQVSGIQFRHKELCPPKPPNWGGTPTSVRASKLTKGLDRPAPAPVLAKISPAPRSVASDSPTAVLVDLSGGARAILESRGSSCRWPSQHPPKEAGFRFCGAPVVSGKSYCPACLRRADGRATAPPSIRRAAEMPRAGALV